MNRVFVTGASGFIGEKLILMLTNYGFNINILVRQSANKESLHRSNITIFTGNILDKSSIRKAMSGCDTVFHLAGLAKMWVKNKSDYYNTNVIGTNNILEAAAEFNLKKIIVISSAGILPPSNKSLTNEISLKQPELFTEYERTKNIAEEIVDSFYQKGLPVIIASPTKVYGPGLISDGNSTTMMIRDYINGKWKIIPGDGTGVMNYVYVDDVVVTLIKLMKEGKPGSRYIIGGENANYDAFFSLIAELSGVKQKLYHIPYSIIKTIAFFEDARARLFKAKPIITSEWVKKLSFNWSKDINKIKTELGYSPSTLREGIKKTIEWLDATKQINLTGNRDHS